MEIRVKKISYIYDNKTKLKTKALDNLSLMIKNNEITSFIGNSSSGKTALANLLALKYLPTNGEIKFGNITISNKNNRSIFQNLKKQIGLVNPNTDTVFWTTSVKKEIALAIKKSGSEVKDKDKRIKDSLKVAGLGEEYLNQNPNDLSKGEQTKLIIAIVLAYNPKLIIFDEPTLYLDAYNKNELVKLIRMMKLRYKKTVVIFSKDTDFIHKITDYVYLIKDGKILKRGDKYKVFSNFKILEKNNIDIPKVMNFAYLLQQKKNVKMIYRDDINDLMKDVYRSVR